jgi:hypothetical protein
MSIKSQFAICAALLAVVATPQLASAQEGFGNYAAAVGEAAPAASRVEHHRSGAFAGAYGYAPSNIGATQQSAAGRVHVYAPDGYQRRRSNNDLNADFRLGGDN